LVHASSGGVERSSEGPAWYVGFGSNLTKSAVAASQCAYPPIRIPVWVALDRARAFRQLTNAALPSLWKRSGFRITPKRTKFWFRRLSARKRDHRAFGAPVGSDPAVGNGAELGALLRSRAGGESLALNRWRRECPPYRCPSTVAAVRGRHE